MLFRSQGKGSPVAIGTAALDYALNRRVEIQYRGPGNVQIEAHHQERDLQPERTRVKTPVKKPVRKPPAPATPTTKP